MTAPVTLLPAPLAQRIARDPRTPIVLVGGTFDPPHAAHIRLAVQARDRAAPAAWLLFVPAARSPHKPPPAASDEDRVAMLRLALHDVPKAVLWTDEIDRAAADPGQPSYTVETLARLLTQAPGAVRLLMGSDQAVSFHRWHEPRRILHLAQPLVLLRAPHESPAGLLAALATTGEWSAADLERWKGWIAPVPPMAASSTDVRAALTAGASPRGLLDPGVERYIREHGLYPPR